MLVRLKRWPASPHTRGRDLRTRGNRYQLQYSNFLPGKINQGWRLVAKRRKTPGCIPEGFVLGLIVVERTSNETKEAA